MRKADYIQETTTSIAGTNGDGAVTLTAVTNKPRISTAFGTSNRFVRYVIEKPASSMYEEGIGQVSSNVLTRTRPQVTWDGSTWKDGNSGSVTALAFGSSPTSGDVIIRLAPTAEDTAPTIPAFQSSLSGDANWRDYRISGHIPWDNSGAGHTLTANREYYAAYRHETAGLLSGIQMEVTTAVAGSTIALALYDFGNNGLPGAKIADFTGFTTATTGIKTDTATGSWSPAGGIWLTPGWYAMGFIASHAIAIRCGTSRMQGQSPFGRYNSYGWADVVYAAGSGTTMPASPSPTTMLDPGTSTGTRPWIGLKVVA